jgi:alpha-ketoglutarate-dependent taurine dioxygenase
MNYHLDSNGWAVIVDNFDLRTATPEDIKQASDLMKTSTLIVFRNQSLTIKDELKIGYMFGNVTTEYAPGQAEFENETADLINDPNGHITRITGALNEHGKPGTAGYVDAMEWHNNQPHLLNSNHGKQRGPLVWLYGVKGTAGSRTSYTNSVLAHRDLDQATKDKIKNLKGVYYATADFRGPIAGGISVDKNAPSQDVVIQHSTGEYGMYHSFYQLERYEGMTREESLPLLKTLHDHIIQDKYCYHHNWQDGDIVIADQWFGIHKRWPFEKIQERLLHRMVFGYVV